MSMSTTSNSMEMSRIGSNDNNSSSNVMHALSNVCNDIESNSNSNSSNSNVNFRVESTSLRDIISNDRSLVLFFNIVGYYYPDDNHSMILRTISRLWQILLLLLAAASYGFFVFFFVLVMTYDSNVVNILHSLLVLISITLQIAGLMYGMRNVNKQLNQSDNSITSSLLAVCKRDSMIFYAIFVVLLVVMLAIIAKEDLTDSIFWLFSRWFNIPIICYLAIALLFTSLSLMEVQVVQQDIIRLIDNNCINRHQYMTAKDKIKYLQSENYYSTQALTITAAINVITFIDRMSRVFSDPQSELIHTLVEITFFLKEVAFFYYILFKVAAINSNNDKIKERLAKKCWDLSDKTADGYQCMLMYQDALTFPTTFKLGPLEIRYEGLLATLVGLVVYSIRILSTINKYTNE